MKHLSFWSTVGLVITLVCTCQVVQAGNGGKDPSNDAFELYGDLFVVARNTNGEAILDRNDCPRPIHVISEDLNNTGYECAFVPLCGDDPLGTACLDLENSIASPGGDTTDEVESCDIWDPYPYMPLVDGANPLFTYLKEVNFGRLAVTRSPTDVIDHGYLEAISRLNTAAKIDNPDYIPDSGIPEYLPNIKTDPAGRLQYFAVDPETEKGAWFTIDAPLENLGLYQRIMMYGTFLPVDYIRVEKDMMYVVESVEPKWSNFYLSEDLWSLHPCWSAMPEGADPSGEIEACIQQYPELYCDPYPDEGEIPLDCNEMLDPTEEDILLAASILAGAGDKTGSTQVDMLIHVNTYLGINDLDAGYYFPYEDMYYPSYVADEYFGGKDPVQLLQAFVGDCGSLEGFPCFNVIEMQVFESGVVDFVANPHCTSWDTDFFYQQVVTEGPLLEYDSSEPDRYFLFDQDHPWDYYPTSNVNDIGSAHQIAQAASDAQKIIWYIHNWEVPDLE